FDHQHFANRLIHLGEQKLESDQWYLSTIHRPENTDDINHLKSILEALQQLKESVILPAQPRIKKKLAELDAYNKYKNIIFVEPLSYLDTIYFAKNAVKIITDSGGLHKEAYLMGTPAVVILRNTGWEETLKGNCNVLAKPDREDILDKVNHTVIDDSCFGEKYYGDGKTAIKICKILGE
ncbi:MAG: UDP-N-acetylglucosamine 2-epimerase, partial [Eubacterium sp.]